MAHRSLSLGLDRTVGLPDLSFGDAASQGGMGAVGSEPQNQVRESKPLAAAALLTNSAACKRLLSVAILNLTFVAVAAGSQTSPGLAEQAVSGAAAASSHPATPEDDLDRLLDQYDEQAAAATKAVQTPTKKPLSKMGQVELRKEGLAKSLAPDNK